MLKFREFDEGYFLDLLPFDVPDSSKSAFVENKIITLYV